MGRLNESREGINGSWLELQGQWADVRLQWRDAVANRFEREWWLPLEEDVPRLLDAMSELDSTLDQALRYTED
jgi:hypothetical protein